MKRNKLLSNSGSAFIMLLMGILVLGYLYSTMGNRLIVGPSGNAGTSSETPQGKAREAVCMVNKIAIQNGLQIYNMQNKAMKELDLSKLSGIIDVSELKKSKCTYNLGKDGKIVCSEHK
ncbi:MAG: hypothetical protein HQM10_24220 [Candidatus Riflebacteria bacterium]|nr:hypothetical protein [Candidatus Riflebacteria bacterium]